jgi:quercetin dioxygenase-like cupin family protein
MPVELSRGNAASEEQAVAEVAREGFEAAAKDYPPGKTEPHSHDYDVLLHILAGEFRLGLVEEGVVHSVGPGDRVFVPAGTDHFEDHGPLRMVVGRREPSGSTPGTAEAA